MTNKIRLTSLLRVEERLLEAEYFGRRLFELASPMFGFELNAYLSAARSVTFLLQKEYRHVSGFDTWWRADCDILREDEAAQFFLELRNYSQKEGRVSIVGIGDTHGRRHHMFAGTVEPIPSCLLNRDVADCCLEHLAKLAGSVLRFASSYPHYSCPSRALTPEGVRALGLDLDAIERTLGFPSEFSFSRPKASVEERLRLYQRYVDAVDFDEIQRIANYVSLPAVESPLALTMVECIERARSSGESVDQSVRVALATEILRRETAR